MHIIISFNINYFKNTISIRFNSHKQSRIIENLEAGSTIKENGNIIMHTA